jgi:hypothetical protein
MRHVSKTSGGRALGGRCGAHLLTACADSVRILPLIEEPAGRTDLIFASPTALLYETVSCLNVSSAFCARGARQRVGETMSSRKPSLPGEARARRCGHRAHLAAWVEVRMMTLGEEPIFGLNLALSSGPIETELPEVIRHRPPRQPTTRA